MLCLDSRCWLSQRRSFNWALTGPVVTVLGVSLWSRYSQPGVSNSNQPGTLLLPSFHFGSIQPPPPRYLNTNAVYCYCANSKYKYIFLFICILTSTIEKKINDKKKGANYYWRLLSRARCENLTGCKWPSAREFETTAYEPVPDEVPVDFPTCFSSCSLTACCFWLRYGAWSPHWPTWRVTSHSPRTPGDSRWSLVLCDWLPSSNLLVIKIHSVFFLGHLER